MRYSILDLMNFMAYINKQSNYIHIVEDESDKTEDICVSTETTSYA
jgi:hypothetical protein